MVRDLSDLRDDDEAAAAEQAAQVSLVSAALHALVADPAVLRHACMPEPEEMGPMYSSGLCHLLCSADDQATAVRISLQNCKKCSC